MSQVKTLDGVSGQGGNLDSLLSLFQPIFYQQTKCQQHDINARYFVLIDNHNPGDDSRKRDISIYGGCRGEKDKRGNRDESLRVAAAGSPHIANGLPLHCARNIWSVTKKGFE